MTENENSSFARLIDPVSRVSEILFGLIMVLTFTCSISAGESGHGEIRTMLVGAIGCNFAWGLVDAIMHLMATLTERARAIATLKAVRKASTQQEAHRVIVANLPPLVASIMKPETIEALRVKLIDLPGPPPRMQIKRQDIFAALGVFLLVFLSTLPVVLPFIFIKETVRALRFSNAIAIAMLFLAGYSVGRHAGASPWRTGIVMVLLGIVLVGITMALGG